MPPRCARCVTRTSIDSTSSRSEYVYLLGLYLGDGTISVHRRGVYRLRIFLDMKYPEIVAECETAMHDGDAGQQGRVAS